MPSTYTLNNGIELIGSGEQSGTWGDTTNTNLSLIDTALDGQVTVTLASAGSSGSPNTLAISDGAASNGRNRMVIFDDGGDLGATAYVQLTPNDAEKIIYVRNDLSGSRSIILFQGTYNASNDYEVPTGTTAVVYFDGGGTGAVAANVFNNAHFDALNVAGTASIASLVATTADINGGTIDGVTLGTNSAVTEAQVDNINIDGNAITSTNTDGNIALTPDGSGEVDISKVDIDSGTIDGVTLGTNSAVTEAQVDNINIDGNAITSTNTDGNIALTPNGSGEVDISKVDINSGTIDGTVIGGTTPADGTFANLTATEGTFSRLNIGADLEWNSSTDSYTANTTPSTVTKVHQGMKRCVLNDDGSVNYYLNPTDSTEKLDGTSANIDGTDGNVMVEIPKFYFRQVRDGNSLIWQVSDVPLAGYQLHPAFFKNGEIVDFRYMGAYDACYLDDTDSTYKSGLNLDDMTSNLDLSNDKLASVSGVYPLVGVTRSECRSLAENVGTGWRVQDFWLTSAVQMLYLVEYGDFNSQNNLGDGNTNGSYVGSSSNQNDSPHTVAGASNSWGNESTDGSQPSSGAKPGTAYMSYRGIENFFGNCWNWVDGVNVGADSQGDWHVSNDDTDFADSTTTNYQFLVNSMPSDGYVTDIADVVGAFIPSSTGGSSSTYLTDYFFDDNGSTNRVARFGGRADGGAFAGAFFWLVDASSSYALRVFGARLCY